MTNPYLFFAIIFALGTGLVVVGTLLVRNERRIEPLELPEPVVVERHPELTWTQTLVDPGTELDAQTRIDMLTRLALLAQPWCTPIVQQALSEERDPSVREVADDMLVMIRARPTS